MNWSGLFDPNTNLKFHACLLVVAFLNARYGSPMMSIPLVAWVLARWIVMGFSWLKRHAAEQAVGDWNGRYYAFDGRQVRIYWDEANTWINAQDLMRAAGHEPGGRQPERLRSLLGDDAFHGQAEVESVCFSEEGAVAYLKRHADERSWKIRCWLEREVLPNITRLRQTNAATYRTFRQDD